MGDSVGQAVGAWSPAWWLSPAVGRTDRCKLVEGGRERERKTFQRSCPRGSVKGWLGEGWVFWLRSLAFCDSASTVPS